MLDQANDARALSQAHDQVFAALTSSPSDARQASYEEMLAPTLGLLAELQLLEQIVLEIERELRD